MSNVTVEYFISAIWAGYLKNTGDESALRSMEEIMEFGRDVGWLEEQDILWKDRMIERRNAARIIHEFLRLKCSEADENDWRKAEKLTDLYDCKACAKHVAQVYLKGIMPAKDKKRFQLLQKVDEDELAEFIYRMFNKNERLLVE